MPGIPTPKQATGNFGEELVAGYLKKRGFKILARNWRNGSYELDIICAKNGTLVFVEVKTRAEKSLESPEEALTPAKQKSLLKAAQKYLLEMEAWEVPCRFDLVSVSLGSAEQKSARLEHIENVIEFDGRIGNMGRSGRGGSPLDSGNSPWQPW